MENNIAKPSQIDHSILSAYTKAKRRLYEAQTSYNFGKSALLGQGFIVTVDGLPINYDSRRKSVTPTYPDRAMRFTSRDANRLASMIRNGNKSTGEVVYWMSLMPDYIKELKNTISVMEEFLKGEGLL